MTLTFKDGRPPLLFVRREFANDALGRGRSGWFVYLDRVRPPVIIRDSEIESVREEEDDGELP